MSALESAAATATSGAIQARRQNMMMMRSSLPEHKSHRVSAKVRQRSVDRSRSVNTKASRRRNAYIVGCLG